MSPQLLPVAEGERRIVLDAVRGLALLGVVLVNLENGFRVSLFTHIAMFHTHPGGVDRAVDVVLAWVFEFKALALLSYLFGVGVGVQAERADRDTVSLLVRRFTVLGLIGLLHTLLLWNGDILTLYALCGLLLLPFTALSGRAVATAGIALILAAPWLPGLDALYPTRAAMHAHAAEATRIYAAGSFAEIMDLRCREAVTFIAPLLIGVLPQTLGLMLLGLASWRTRILSRPSAHRRLLLAVFTGAGSLGAVATTLQVWSRHAGRPNPTPDWLSPYAAVLLALAYGAGLWLWWTAPRSPIVDRLVLVLSAAGRMTLTSYLAQSVLFCALFYGYGGGLFGKIGPAAAALLGVVVFVAQTAASVWWLERFRFGPVEWLWRSLTYRRWLPNARST